MPAIELSWLGNPVIKLDGTVVAAKTHKTTALIAYMTVTRRDHTRDHLSSLLWPEFDQRRARANLRQCLLHVRQMLGDDFQESRGDAIRVNPGADVWCDTQMLAAAIADFEGRDRDGSQANPECLESMKAIVAKYRGPFLEGFNLPGCSEFDLWQESQRQECGRLLSIAFERLVGLSDAAGDRPKAISYARRWLLEDACNEGAHRLLMRLYYEIGQKHSALRQYEECAQHLKEELGVSPEPSTEKLLEAIAHDRPLPAPARRAREDAAAPPLAADSAFSLPSPKYAIPAEPNFFVERERLRASLETGMSVPLTLISGPAGFGKTTLLASWARRAALSREARVAWLYADAADNRPERFLDSIRSCLGVSTDRVSETEASYEHGALDKRNAPTVDSILVALRDVKEPLVVIIDDLHLINDRKALGLLLDLIDGIPANVHLFVSTRADPPIPLSRLRIGRRLIEVRTDDLRFSPEEIALFLKKRGLRLTSAEAIDIGEKTEGWITGLHIIADAIKDSPARHAAIRAFDGRHQRIRDYLLEEVIDRQGEDVRGFFACTSILEKMTDSLCRAVTGMADCQAILERLASMNLFVVQLDENRTWFRYHHLFKDVLENRLRQRLTNQALRRLHMAAARWYEANGFYDDAIHHGQLANDPRIAIRIIRSVFVETMSRGEYSRLLAWIEKIPDAIVRNNAILCVAKAWSLLFSGLPEQAELYIGLARRVHDASGSDSGACRSYITAARAYIAECHGEDQQGIDLAASANRQLQRDDYFFRGIMFFLLGRLYRKVGDLPAAEEAFRKIADLGKSHGNLLTQAIGTCDIATIAQIQGRLTDAQGVCRQFLLQYESHPAFRNGAASRVMFRYADVLYEKNKLKEARRYVAMGMNSILGKQNPNDLAFGFIELAQVCLAAGEAANVRHALDRLDELKARFDLHPHLKSWIEICKIRFELATGDYHSALGLARRLVSERPDGPLNREFEEIEYYRVIVNSPDAQDTVASILDSIGKIHDLARKSLLGKRYFRYYRLLLLEAIAHRVSGNLAEGAALLRKVLVALEPEGYVRTFTDEGATIAAMLAEAMDDERWVVPRMRAYLGSVLESFPERGAPV